MIEIKKVKPCYECNICYSKDKIIEFVFRGNESNSGTSIVVCKECRKKLHDLIEELDGEQDAAD